MAEYADKLNNAVKEAMKNKDNQRRDALRLLTSAMKQVTIDTQKELSADDELSILQKEAKKRRESIVELDKAGRAEQAEAERYELALIESYLPQQLTREEIVTLAQAAIAQSGATSGKEMGKVMGLLNPQVKGRADGRLVSEVVKELLG